MNSAPLPLALAGLLHCLQTLSPLPVLAQQAPVFSRTFVMRHGESVPSSQQRICSAMAAGIDPRNGLTDKGRTESAAASRAWIRSNAAAIDAAWRRGQLAIISSPFSRSRETAEILVATLEQWRRSEGQASNGAPTLPIRIENDLRERGFGRFEGQSPSGPIYRSIWDEDARDPTATPAGVESAEAVQRRVAALITRLERLSRGQPNRITVLVSHGDTLKILQASAQDQSPSAHQDPRLVKPFQTAEIRELIWASPSAAGASPSRPRPVAPSPLP